MGFLAGVTLAAVSSLGALFGLPDVPDAAFGFLTRILPGAWLTAGIEGMIRGVRALGAGPTSVVAKQVEAGSAVALVVAGSLVAGALAASTSDRARRAIVATAAALLGGFAAAGVLVLAPPALGRGAGFFWIAILCIAWAWVVLLGSARTSAVLRAPLRVRRDVLRALGSTLVVVSALSVGLGRWIRARRQRIGAGARPIRGVGPAIHPVAGRIDPAPGTRPELTVPGRFYRVDINIRPPAVEAARWRLRVDGLVARPAEIPLRDLASRPSVSQAITLECISNPVGGDLISTAVWTGIPLRVLMQEAGMRPGARFVNVESIDGYHESVPMSDVLDERTLLVHAMDGAPLAAEHGFPLRIYIPNRFGMKQPKWIRRLEVSDREARGYWVERGWSREAVVKTTSVIDAVGEPERAGGNRIDASPAGTVPVGGIAFAGARGITAVEVQVDGGPWAAAQLRAPPLGPLTWVQWRYDWPRRPGRHVFRVRARDGQGIWQTADTAPPHPDGATGLFTVARET